MTNTTANRIEDKGVLKGKVGLGVRSAFSRLYTDYRSEDDIFKEVISQYIVEEADVLDAGCGGGFFFQYPWKNQVRSLVGCDVSEALGANSNISYGVKANLETLPFADNSFDLIFSRYVFEHISEPEVVFSEFARLLKPGGKIIILTPSKYHYVTLVSRFSPHWVHELVSSIRGNAHEDAFPTRYLANSRSQLSHHANLAGLTLQEFITTEVCPNYLLWSLPTFLLGVAYERIVNRFDSVRGLRVSIIAVFEG